MVVALHGLGGLAAFSLLLCEMPRLVAWPLATCAVAYGVHLGRRESRRPRHELVWAAGGVPMIDGVVLEAAQLHWRGSLAFLRWRSPDGRVLRLSWWPDALPAASRRELRLAALDGRASAPAASMAP